jgi:hypothetical protein
MFYDLNVPYSSDDPEISDTLSFLAERMSLFPGTRPKRRSATLKMTT